ncbi:4Fe-4S dicluster domain-containing protein [Corticimicrobacter populi]|uniref:Ferredoxin n=1 Tax=Corticimicrobacter populi TaxID=2175229 RepID=A0A2V1K358_9BURK|nr:4Fe-4S dicluster domain-containing protein [Corticimicrobacter populi]PWF24653.1 ferredoxin [Corticimicrobacter populi]
MTETVQLIVNGQALDAAPHATIIQAYAAAGATLTANVGCMGQGVCGSCRCLVRREGEPEVRTALACETQVEAGMLVSFIDYFSTGQDRVYDLASLGDGWSRLQETARIFPQAAHCRHCGGCDRACPKGLSVQQGVAHAVAGDFAAVDDVFDQCVMCNLCSLACPEDIRPNHLGLFVRRQRASAQRPADLLRRLNQIESGRMLVDPGTDASLSCTDAGRKPGAQP